MGEPVGAVGPDGVAARPAVHAVGVAVVRMHLCRCLRRRGSRRRQSWRALDHVGRRACRRSCRCRSASGPSSTRIPLWPGQFARAAPSRRGCSRSGRRARTRLRPPAPAPVAVRDVDAQPGAASAYRRRCRRAASPVGAQDERAESSGTARDDLRGVARAVGRDDDRRGRRPCRRSSSRRTTRPAPSALRSWSPPALGAGRALRHGCRPSARTRSPPRRATSRASRSPASRAPSTPTRNAPART